MTRISTAARTVVFFIGGILAAFPGNAGVNVLFSDGFEEGNTSVWEQPTRYVVFEGFYNPG